MELYAENPARRARQVTADVVVLAWVVVWVLIGTAVHDAVARLAAPGRTLEQAGTSLGGGLGDAAEAVGGVPLVGDALGAPLESAGGAADAITAAGVEIQDVVERTALVAGLSVAAWPVLVVVGVWLALRLRFARRAAAARELLAEGAGLELFALRALTRVPLRSLATVDPDPAGAWRRGDPDVVRALAALELREAGLRPPPA